MPIDLKLQQLADELGYFDTSLSLVKAPLDWLRANIDNTRSTWNKFSTLPKDDVVDLENLVYPRFFAYTLAYTKLRGSGKDLVEFKTNISRWIHPDEITLLQNHRAIKDTLWAFQNRSRNNRTIANSDIRDRTSKLLHLDVLGIAARILAIMNDDRRERSLLDLRGPQAKTLLDLLQRILDGTDVDVVRAPILKLLLKVSDGSELYPSSLILRRVTPQGKESVTAGTYGDIWEGTFGGDAVAIKVMKVDPAYIKRAVKVFCKEAMVWRQVRHPNILSFCGVCQWPGASYRVCLVSPWMKNGNIVQYLGRNLKTNKRSLVLDIVKGLHYLHTFDPPVVHGDLRGTNILITLDHRACIGDFGICTVARDSLLPFTQSAGANQGTTLRWLAPELFSYGGSGDEVPRLDFATDIYAFGCVCYEIFAGRPKFSELRAIFEVVAAVSQDHRPTRPSQEALDEAMWELMNDCWAMNSASRPTTGAIVEYLLSHPAVGSERPHDEATLRHPELGHDGGADEWVPWERPRYQPPDMSRNSMAVQDIIIALIGPTGSGKSNFINVATQQKSVIVGDDLASCTQAVQAIACAHPDGSGRNIIFVDTPGFDDTERTDYEVLDQIASWLKETYEEHMTLTGLLFFHRITDVRMRGTPLRNLTMFEALCGQDALENVVLTTTLWDEVHPEIGEARERELREEFWAPLMGEGRRMDRFGNTARSAWDIINLFTTNSPRALLVQKEMVDDEKELKATSAFKVLVRWWEQVFGFAKVKGKFGFRRGKQPPK